MDIYILSKDIENRFSKYEVVELYNTLAWTEKYQEVGDFELELDYTKEMYLMMDIGTFLGIPASRRVMWVTKRYTELNDEGARVIKVSGKSIENIFNYRHYLNYSGRNVKGMVGLYEGSYNANIEWLVQRNSVENETGNRIRNLLVGPPNGYPSYNLVPSEVGIIEQGYLLPKIESLCKEGNVGYRLLPIDPVTRNTPLCFNSYTPIDRTQKQSPNDYVVFGETLDNLESSRTLSSIEGYYNRVFVDGRPISSRTMWEPEGSLDKDDFQRFLAYEPIDLENHDQEETGLTPRQVATSTGDKLLSDSIMEFLVDGEIDSVTSNYVYEEDYFLGDIVHYVDVTGDLYDMQVVTQTIISDNEGVRSYPTLRLKSELDRQTDDLN